METTELIDVVNLKTSTPWYKGGTYFKKIVEHTVAAIKDAGGLENWTGSHRQFGPVEAALRDHDNLLLRANTLSHSWERGKTAWIKAVKEAIAGDEVTEDSALPSTSAEFAALVQRVTELEATQQTLRTQVQQLAADVVKYKDLSARTLQPPLVTLDTVAAPSSRSAQGCRGTRTLGVRRFKHVTRPNPQDPLDPVDPVDAVDPVDPND